MLMDEELLDYNAHKHTPSFLFDVEQGALLETSTFVPTVVLTGKPCEVLRHLIASPNTVLSSSDIQQGVWGSTIVTSGSVKDYIAQIRAALNDSVTNSMYIETIRGRGYRYLGGIRTSNTQATDLALLPTLAIIPPCFSGKTNHEFEMVGEIVAANLIESISQSPLLNIISRLSTRQFKNGNADPGKIGSTLGADYVLSGLYHCQNDKLVLFVELSHVDGSHVVWAEKINGTASDWSNGNSDHLQQLTRVVLDKVIQHQIDLTSSEGIETLASHTMIINAITFMHSSSQSVFNRTEKLLLQMINRLPTNATVSSLLAQWHLMCMNRAQGWNLSGNSAFRDNAFRYAEQALTINPLHAHANTILGSLEARLNNRFDTALDHHNIAMNSNPNNALNHCFKASAYTYQDDNFAQKQAAVQHANQAIMLSPLDPQLYLFKTVAAAANQYAGHLETGYQHALDSYKINPNHTSNMRTLISILIDLNKLDEAKQLKDKLMKLDPTFTIKAYCRFGPGIQSNFGNHIARNLEEAGVPVH